MNTIRTKKYTTILAFCCFGIIANAQTEGVSIKSTVSPPHPSAMLDVESTNKGVLIPRVSIGNVAIASPVLSPVDGLLVYNTNASIVGGNGIGFYHWTSTPTARWEKLGGSSFWTKIDVTNNIQYNNGKVLIGNALSVLNYRFTVNNPSGLANALILGLGGSVSIEADAGRYFLKQTGKQVGLDFYKPCFQQNFSDGLKPGFSVSSWRFDSNNTSWISLDGGMHSDIYFTVGSGRGFIFRSGNTEGYVTIGSNGSICNSSDSTLKKNIEGISEMSNKLMQCRPVKYNWKTSSNGTPKSTGFIAQEVEIIFPELVITNDILENSSIPESKLVKIKSVNYIGFTTLLVKGFQEQQSKIQQQQTTINSLLQRVLVLEGQ